MNHHPFKLIKRVKAGYTSAEVSGYMPVCWQRYKVLKFTEETEDISKRHIDSYFKLVAHELTQLRRIES